MRNPAIFLRRTRRWDNNADKLKRSGWTAWYYRSGGRFRSPGVANGYGKAKHWWQAAWIAFRSSTPTQYE